MLVAHKAQVHFVEWLTLQHPPVDPNIKRNKAQCSLPTLVRKPDVLNNYVPLLLALFTHSFSTHFMCTLAPTFPYTIEPFLYHPYNILQLPSRIYSQLPHIGILAQTIPFSLKYA